MLFRTFLAALLVVTTVASGSPARAEEAILRVSMVTLLANPEQFHGKLVATVGVLQLGFESNGLFLSKEHLEHRVTENAIWVSPSAGMQEQRELLNGSYVSVAGRFNARARGHMGLYSAVMEEVMWAARQPGT